MNNRYSNADIHLHQKKGGTVPPYEMSYMRKGIYAQINPGYNNSNVLKHVGNKGGIIGEQENTISSNNNYEFTHNSGNNANRGIEERKESKENTSFMDSGVINNYVELYINKAKEIYYFHVFYNYLKLGWPEKEAAEESKKYIFITLNNYFAQMKNTIFSSPQFVKRVNKCVASNLLYYQEPTNLHQFLQQLQLQSPQQQNNAFSHEQSEKYQNKNHSISQNNAQNVNLFDFMNLERFDLPSSNVNDTMQNYSRACEMGGVITNDDKENAKKEGIDKTNMINAHAEYKKDNHWSARNMFMNVNDRNTPTVERNDKTNAYTLKEDKIDEMIKGIEEMKRLSEQKKNTKKRTFSDMPIYEEDKQNIFSGSKEIMNNEEKGIYMDNSHNATNLNAVNNVNNKNFVNDCTRYDNNKLMKETPFSNETTSYIEEKKKIRFSINTAQSKIYQKMKINKMNNILGDKKETGNENTDADNYSKEMGIEDISEVSNISDDKAEEKEKEIKRERLIERGDGSLNNIHHINKQFNDNNNINSSYLNCETNNFQQFENSNNANKTYETTATQHGYNLYRNEHFDRSNYNSKNDMHQNRDKGVKGSTYYDPNIDANKGNYGGRNNFSFGIINNNNCINNSSSINNSSINFNNLNQTAGRYTACHGNIRMEKNSRCINESDMGQTNNNVKNVYGSIIHNSNVASQMFHMNKKSHIVKDNLKDNLKDNENSYIDKNGMVTINEDIISKADIDDHGYDYANGKIFYKDANNFNIDVNTPDANFYEYHSGGRNNRYNKTVNNNNNNNTNNIDNTNDNSSTRYNYSNNNSKNNINNNISIEKRSTLRHGNRVGENMLNGVYAMDNYSNKNKIKETEKMKKGLYKFNVIEEERYSALEENVKLEKGKERERKREDREEEEDEEEEEEGEGEEEVEEEESDDSSRNIDSYESEMKRKNHIDKNNNNNMEKLPGLSFFSDKNANIDNHKCYNAYIEKLKFYYKDSLKNKEFGKQFNYFLTCLNHHKNKKGGVAILWLENVIPSVDHIYRANQFIRGLMLKKKGSSENVNGGIRKSEIKGIVIDPQFKQKIEDVQSKEKRKERFFGGTKLDRGDSNDNLFYFDTGTKSDKENISGYNLEKLIEMYDDISCYKNKDFVGQCKSIQKFFFRLTSLPEPKNVRSFSVLKCTYAYILYKYNIDRNYKYINEQFRSLRQDLNIQSILHVDVINIYETNIRICIVNNDLFQFLQCINKLFEMYQKLNIKKSKVEFLCYKMIYLILQNMHQEFCQMYFNLTEEERNDENIKLCHYLNDCVKNKMYLINVNMIEPIDNEKNHDYIYSRIYVNNQILNYMDQLMDLSENYTLNSNMSGLSAFIKEHGNTPKIERMSNENSVETKNGIYKMPFLTNCLIILFLPKYRLLALINICKTSMKVSISTLTKLLNFENDEECLKFLKEVNTDINNNDVMTKPSLANLLKSPLLKNRYINHIR